MKLNNLDDPDKNEEIKLEHKSKQEEEKETDQ
jgi:hypothetical protein